MELWSASNPFAAAAVDDSSLNSVATATVAANVDNTAGANAAVCMDVLLVVVVGVAPAATAAAAVVKTTVGPQRCADAA